MKSSHFIKAVFLAVLMSSISMTQPLLADERRNGYRHDGRPDVSLDYAVKKARNRYNGRVISAETVGAENDRMHNIRILTDDGRVRRLRVDPSTGEYVKGKPRRR